MSNTVGRDKLKELLSEALQESPKCHGQIMGNNPMYVMYGGELIYVYIKNLTPAQLSNDNPDIWRAQLSSHKDFEDVLKSDYLFIFLGYDAENDVYATWNPYWTKQRLNNANNVSFYSRYSAQKEASENQEIISLDLNNNGKVVIFPRDMLTDYLDNMSDWFDKETQYVALGSRLRVDANTAYKMLCDNHNLMPFKEYLQKENYSQAVVDQYVGSIRTLLSKGCFTRQRILFMSKDDFEGYKVILSTFLMADEFRTENRYVRDIYKLALTAYINFLIDLRDSATVEENEFEESEDPQVAVEKNIPEEPTTEEIKEAPLYDFDESIDYELPYIDDQKLTKITNPKLLMELRPVLKVEIPDLIAAYGVIYEFYGDRFPNMQLSDWNNLLTGINWEDPFGRDNDTDSRRQKSEILRVTLPSGEVIQNAKVVDTFVDVISRLDPQKVHNLGIIHAKDNIVSRQRNQKYIVAQKDIGNGWYLLTNPTTRRKQEILRQISDSLDLNWEIELVSYQTGAIIKDSAGAQEVERTWRREELVLVLDLYYRIENSEISKSNPEVQELAKLIKRKYREIVEMLHVYESLDMGQNTGFCPSLCKDLWEQYRNKQYILSADASSISLKIERSALPPVATPAPSVSPDKPVNQGKSWDEEEDEKLIALVENYTPYDKIAQQLGRTEKSVYYRLETLGYMSSMEREELCKKLEKKAASQPATVDPRSHTIEIYRKMLLNMHRAPGSNGTKAPHKVILMLAILGYYKNKSVRSIPSNIKMSDLQVLFADYWRKYVNPSQGWTQNLSTPWERMDSEPFWHRCADSSKGCFLDATLQELLIDADIRKDLWQSLKSML